MKKEEIEEYEKLMKNRPHIVILGAGASVATIPNGDLNNNKISVMNGFLKKLCLEKLIKGVDLKTKSDNIEDIYTELYDRPELSDVKLEVESTIYEYFSNLKIPNEPTIYDLLLLSLRSKDLVATFNWDPLLLQAYQRALRFTDNLPELSFLHGNVAVGLCEEHKCGGLITNLCSVCGQPLKPIKLLYPIKQKNYNSDLYTRDSWNVLKHYLKKAYIVTIFGYSAPLSDIEAIGMLKEAWGNSEERNLEQIEIIDIKKEDELRKTWQPFIHTHHYQTTDTFYNSLLSNFPRRTCECVFDNLMNCMWLNPDGAIRQNMTWDDIHNYYDKLFIDERQNSNHTLNSFWTVK